MKSAAFSAGQWSKAEQTFLTQLRGRKDLTTDWHITLYGPAPVIDDGGWRSSACPDAGMQSFGSVLSGS